MKKHRNVKNASMNIRISAEQKKKYEDEARNCNMKLSEYVLHLLQNKKINVIENGSEIAKAMFELNNTLNKCITYSNIPADKVREAVDRSVSKLNDFFNGKESM